jgi:hypothetical protein
MNSMNIEEVRRKTLTYLLCNDIIRAAVTVLGSSGSADKIKQANAIADKLIEAAKNKDK